MKYINNDDACIKYLDNLNKKQIVKIFDDKKKSILRNHLILKYIESNSDLRILFLFPKRNKDLDNILFDKLKENYSIIIKKNLDLINLTQAFNLFRVIFQNEEWIGNIDNFYENAKLTLPNYFNANNKKIEIILFESKNKLNLYQEINNIYKSELNNIYISQNHELTYECAKFLFHYNSVIMTAERMDLFFLNFEKILFNVKNEYKNINNFIFTGSSVMSALGIRKPKDFDIFHTNDFILPEFLSSDNSKIKLINYTLEELLFDPRNHFFYMGLKFIHPKILLELKKKKYLLNKNEKDKDDIELLKKFLKLK